MTISATLRSAMFDQETGDGLLPLLTISHGSLAAPIRVVYNNVDITSRGNLFTAYAFDIILPSDDPNSPPNARLVIDNVSREIGQAIRSIATAASVLIEVVRIKDNDAVELSYPQLQLRNVRYNAGQVTGDLLSDDLQREPFPAHTFNPSYFPGLF